MCGGSTVPFGAPYGHFADAASTIKEAQHPRVLAWGPAGDHTLCAMVNDLRVCEPLARRSPCHTPAVTWGNVLPRFTGGQVVARRNSQDLWIGVFARLAEHLLIRRLVRRARPSRTWRWHGPER